MHSFTLDQLQSFEDQARQEDSPHLYLQLLSPLHYQWHTTPRRIGFLLFHWHLISAMTNFGHQASINATAPECSYTLSPSELRRLAPERCPEGAACSCETAISSTRQ
jgi:hypothetical protein